MDANVALGAAVSNLKPQQLSSTASLPVSPKYQTAPSEVAAGGVAGFASKGSVPSLLAGGISGLGLIACGRTSNFKAAAVISATWH